MYKNIKQGFSLSLILVFLGCITGFSYGQTIKLTSHQLNLSAGKNCVGTNCVLFISDRDGSIDLYKMDLAGNNVIRLTNDSAFEMEAALSPNGDKIAYVVIANGAKSYLYEIDINGNNKRLLTSTDGEIQNIAWSKGSGNKIAYILVKQEEPSVKEDIWIIDAMETTPTSIPLTTDGHSYEFDFSPDGSKIVYYSSGAGNPSGIWVMNADGSDKHYLVDGYSPVWSSNGGQIAYRVSGGMYIISPSGGSSTLITTDYVGEIVWSTKEPEKFFYTYNHKLWCVNITTMSKNKLNFPSGDIWVFNILDEENEIIYDDVANIYKLNLTGNPQPINFTNNSLPGVISTPKWSPDGNKVAYLTMPNSQANGLSWGMGLWIIDKYGNNREEITSAKDWIEDILWSPDGTKIVYGVSEGGMHLCLVNLADKSTKTLTTEWSYYPSFSPEGDRIVYYGKAGNNYGICLMNSDGNNKTFLTEGNDPAWAPDGTKIAYFSNKWTWKEGTTTFTGGLFIIPPSGTPATQLISGDVRNPVWSPESSMIAYTIGNKIWIVKKDGSQNWIVYTANDDVWSLCFSPDSQYLAFSDDVNVYTVKIDGTEVKQINPANTIAWDVDWSWQNMLAYSGLGGGSEGSPSPAPPLKILSKANKSRYNLSISRSKQSQPLQQPTQTQEQGLKRGNDIYVISMGKTPVRNLESVIVYPNPYYGQKHIYFANLTQGDTIKIFTIAGELVKEIKVESSPQSWDVRNDVGKEVASGIYIYLIKDTQGNKKVGKLGVIR